MPEHLSKLILARVRSWLIFRCSTAHDRACLLAAWNLVANWSGYFGNIAAKQKLDDTTVINCVDRWIEDLLAFVSYQSPYALGVKLRRVLIGAK
jgi:hypothetical protein